MGALVFTTPLLLLALIVLPILWWLLRAVPPAPIRRRFPGVALLLGLNDDETQTDTTPWWLLLLRILAVAAFIVGFAGPVLNPKDNQPGSGPLLLVMDGSWASAPDWSARLDRARSVLAEAGREGRPVAIAMLSAPQPGALIFQTADTALAQLSGMVPNAWSAPSDAVADWADRLGEENFETVWFSDGLDYDTRELLTEAFQDKGNLTVIEAPRGAIALQPARFEDGTIILPALRSRTDTPSDVGVTAFGPDPNGIEQVLATATLSFGVGAAQTEVAIALPTELRNRVRRFEIDAVRSAGAVSLTDDALKRREVGLIAPRRDQEQQDVLSPLFYLRKALVPTADLIDGTLDDMLLANPEVIIFADVAVLSENETAALTDWIDEGGMLVRFAGSRTASVEHDDNDPLMPVRLRAGGRSVGGAMSWGAPKKLRAFTRESPFFGLAIPDDVEVSSQVVAQPDPELADRTIAALADGTPLVTRASLGSGQVVLFHVTANTDWSTLPLSGLFVQMLERLAISTRPSVLQAEDLEGTTWVAEDVLDGFGTVRSADALPGVEGALLAARDLGPNLPPGLYAGGNRRVALNVVAAEDTLQPATWPGTVTLSSFEREEETPLKGLLLTLALGLLALDILASLFLSGRMKGPRSAVAGLLAAFLLVPGQADAQSAEADARAIEATSEVVLAYIETGDAAMDRVSRQGLQGLSRSLFLRTSVEPADPIAVSLETDELSFFPMIYWPISERQALPSAEAYAKLNRYLRTGGMIVFDTGDGNLGGFGSSTPAGRRLQRLARPLDIPALAPVPSDHVLTRSFYLLQDFPGRHTSRDVWVEAAPANAEQVEGLPFRNLNDGVTPVLIGGNDWAAAWAVDDQGKPIYRVGRGFAGERQRELAIRFGINLVMHVLTGNYKSDQVHVPALLDRLGN